MSLKFFFNRKGPVVLSLLFIGWVANIWHLIRLSQEWSVRGTVTGVSFLIYLFLASCLTFIRFYPWYKKSDRGAGIEEHFAKTLVPIAYLLPLTAILYTFWLSCSPVLLFSSVVFTVILSVNLLLLRFHFQDTDPLTPGYFSRNLYLQ